MMKWYRKSENHKLEYKSFVFEYGTATELGCMVAQSGCGMPNPYEPDCTDYDDFFEATCEYKQHSTNKEG